jgi:hypothetical protein
MFLKSERDRKAKICFTFSLSQEPLPEKIFLPYSSQTMIELKCKINVHLYIALSVNQNRKHFNILSWNVKKIYPLKF